MVESASAAKAFGADEEQIVISIAHVPVVKSVLRNVFKVELADPIDQSEQLGLALFTFSPAELPFGELFRELFKHFETHYLGWVPTFGKNRLLGNVVDGGEVSFGSVPAGVAEPTIIPDAISGWPVDRGGAGRNVRVGVLDTAVANSSPVADFVSGDSSFSDLTSAGAISGHAAFVAGLILSQAPGAEVVVRRVLSDRNGQASAWDVAKAIVKFADDGIDVLNLSLLCHTSDGKPPLVLSTAIARLNPKIVVVAAAGNYGEFTAVKRSAIPNYEPPAALELPESDTVNFSGSPAYPAALDEVVAVGSADAHGGLSRFTPHNAPWIDVLVAGEELISTYLDGWTGPQATQEFNGFASWSGTSFSAALVTGVIAKGTAPGRTSARESWEKIRAGLPARKSDTSRPVVAPFLPVRLAYTR